MQIALIILLSVLAYTWLLYPFLLAVISRSVSRSKIEGIRGAENVQVAILFAAHNEEKVIRARLGNLVQTRSQNILQEKQSEIINRQSAIWVGIDGSTDKTAEIAREFASTHDNIHVVEFKERRGKVAVLKDLVRKSREQLAGNNEQNSATFAKATVAREVRMKFQVSGLRSHPSSILVFTDANTMFKPDALEKLLSHFDDPAVGGVCGRLVFKESADPPSPLRLWRTSCGAQSAELRTQNPEPGTRDQGSSISVHNSPLDLSPRLPVSPSPLPPSEGFYWRWENQLKAMESSIDSCLGANGAIYAVRSSFFRDDIPDNTIVDDFVIGMKVREQGYRMIYEPGAVAEEEFPEEKHEWRRRVRIGAGDCQALVLCWRCLLPRYGNFAWQFWSHKVLRWVTPHIVLLLVVDSLFLVWKGGLSAGKYLPLAVMAGMAGFILCSVMGRMFHSSSTSPLAGFFRMCSYFLDMNAALFAGSIRFLAGNLKGYWERTPRA